MTAAVMWVVRAGCIVHTGELFLLAELTLLCVHLLALHA